MNLRLFFGIALFLIGIGTAVVGITNVGEGRPQPSGAVAGASLDFARDEP